MKIIKECWNCSEVHSFVVNGDDYRRWQRGEALAQDAMPYLDENQLALLVGEICSRCKTILSEPQDNDGMFDL